MVIATLLGGLATLFWLGLIAYIAYVLVQRSRGRPARISITLVILFLVAATVTSTMGAGVVVIQPGEVGVVFNAISGTRSTPLKPGINFIIPYIDQVYRFSTREQVYTMSIIREEGDIKGDDSLWSPTSEGLQVGVDSSTRYRINPDKAAYILEHFRDGLENVNEVLVRPAIRSMVRLHVSQYTVTEIYGPKRGEIQTKIEADIRGRFQGEGLDLLSFDIRNINFTDDYANSIEQKQIAQQEAERMKFVLEREEKEAQRKKIEAEGFKSAAIIKAEGDAESLRLISEALAANPSLLTYRYIEKLAPNIQVMMLPSGAPFIIDVEQMGVTQTTSQPLPQETQPETQP